MPSEHIQNGHPGEGPTAISKGQREEIEQMDRIAQRLRTGR